MDPAFVKPTEPPDCSCTVEWGATSREDLDAYEQSDLYKRITERARAFYVGDYWVKHFEVRLGEELKR